MGMEHERIHLETSSVLIRQMPVSMVTAPVEWHNAPETSGKQICHIIIIYQIYHCTQFLGTKCND